MIYANQLSTWGDRSVLPIFISMLSQWIQFAICSGCDQFYSKNGANIFGPHRASFICYIMKSGTCSRARIGKEAQKVKKGVKKWQKIGQKGSKRVKTGQKGSKRVKKGQKGSKRVKTGQKGTKRAKIPYYGTQPPNATPS